MQANKIERERERALVLLIASEIEETSWIYANKDHPLLCFRVHAKGVPKDQRKKQGHTFLLSWPYRRKWELLLRPCRSPALLVFRTTCPRVLYHYLLCKQQSKTKYLFFLSLFSVSRFTLKHACMNLRDICYHWSIRFLLCMDSLVKVSTQIYGSTWFSRTVKPPPKKIYKYFNRTNCFLIFSHLNLDPCVLGLKCYTTRLDPYMHNFLLLYPLTCMYPALSLKYRSFLIWINVALH